MTGRGDEQGTGARLDLEALKRAASGCTIGSDLRYLRSVDSTNRYARELKAGEWRHGTVVISDFQEQGRGRMGRTWIAPPSTSLLLSTVLAPPAGSPPAHLTMLAALAVCDAIGQMTALQTGIKWPNDVMVSGGKVAGILVEHAPQGGLDRYIVGLGINVNFDPRELPGVPREATSLQLELGRAVDRVGVAQALFKALDMWYGRFTAKPGLVFEAWASRLLTVGLPVTVVEGPVSWRGVATGVEGDGALRVLDEAGTIKVLYAGDVSIR